MIDLKSVTPRNNETEDELYQRIYRVVDTNLKEVKIRFRNETPKEQYRRFLEFHESVQYQIHVLEKRQVGDTDKTWNERVLRYNEFHEGLIMDVDMQLLESCEQHDNEGFDEWLERVQYIIADNYDFISNLNAEWEDEIIKNDRITAFRKIETEIIEKKIEAEYRDKIEEMESDEFQATRIEIARERAKQQVAEDIQSEQEAKLLYDEEEFNKDKSYSFIILIFGGVLLVIALYVIQWSFVCGLIFIIISFSGLSVLYSNTEYRDKVLDNKYYKSDKTKSILKGFEGFGKMVEHSGLLDKGGKKS